MPRHMRARVWVRAVPLLVPFALAVLLFASATLGDKVISASNLALYSPPFTAQSANLPSDGLQADSGFVFESDGLIVRDALRHWRLPIWTPSVAGGVPLLADQQSAPLFPLTWIGVLFPYNSSRAWINVLKLTLAALGTYLLARALALRRGPALLGGVTYGFSTYLVAWLLHPHSNAYVLLPWALLAADRLCWRGTVRDMALLALALGIAYLGGQPESSLIVSLATAAWVIHRLIGAGLVRRDLVRRGILCVLAAALGAALAAVMLLPLAEALHQSVATSRAEPPLATRAIITLFFPKYWASGGPDNFAERTLYLGALPTLLSAAGLAAKRPRGPQLFFAGLALVSMIVAFNTGPISRTIDHLPVLDRANLDRVLILASFAIAMLAAFGFQLFLNGSVGERRRMLIVAVAVALVPVVVVLGAHPGWLGHLPDGLKRAFGVGASTQVAESLGSVLRWLGFAAAAILLFAAATRWRRRSPLLIAAAVGLAALDLLTLVQGYNPAITEAEASPPTPPAVTVMRRLTAAGGRVVGIDGLEPNTASRWGLDDARGHEDPAVARVSLLWYVLGGGVEENAPGVNLLNPRTPKLLDVFGVRAILLPASDRQSVLRAGARVSYAGPGGVVLSNPRALPPAFVAYDWRTSPGRTASLFLTAAGTAQQDRDDPVIETGERPASTAAGPATPARIVSRSDTEVTVDVQARAAGQLVLLDTFYPGWHAKVDGHDEPIRAADTAFRAVAVPPGRHTVRFYYQPTSVLVGGLVSIAALLAIIACLIGIRRRRPRRIVKSDSTWLEARGRRQGPAPSRRTISGMTALGISLLIVGAIIVVAEAHVQSLGLLGGPGVVVLGVGTVLAVSGLGGGLVLGLVTAVILAAAAAGVLTLSLSKGMAVRRRRVRAGPEGMIGHVGVVQSWVEPTGKVLVDGALWHARRSACEPEEEVALHQGDRVIVERLSGLTLSVRPAEEWELIT